MWQKEFLNILKTELATSKKRNPLLSIRSFSKRLKISSGALSEVLSGKRMISFKRAMAILKTLERPQIEIDRLEKMHKNVKAKVRVLLPDDAYEVVTKWQHFAILSIYELPHPPKSSKELAIRLGLPELEVQKNVDFLLRCKLLKKGIDGDLYPAETAWTTKDGIPSEKVRESHRNGLALAERALNEIPQEQRDFVSLTFLSDPKKMERAKKEIRKFSNKMVDLMGPGPNVKDVEVSRISVQLFPVDQWHQHRKPQA